MLKIGISACFFHADPKRALFKGMTLQYIEQNMAHWVMQRDALALMVPSPDGTTRRAAQRSRRSPTTRASSTRCVLMGGSDVCPESYGEAALQPEWNGDRIRDDYEIALLRAFVAQGKPVLGICRGAQVINVALGGTLYQDIATQLPGALNHRNWDIYAENCHATAIVPAADSRALYPGRVDREDQFGPPSGGQGPRAAIWSSRRGPNPTASSRRCAGPARRTCSACSGIRSSTIPATRRARRHADPRRLPRRARRRLTESAR